MRIRSLAMAGVASAILSIGCHYDDAVAPSDLAGTYAATTFTRVSGGQGLDVLAAGGSLTITLNANGTTTGLLSIPASLNNGVALNESMTGTFTIVGGTVHFDQTADTFVRDMSFSIAAQTLNGTLTTNDGGILVILTRA